MFKIGLGVSVGLVVLLGVVGYFAFVGIADRPTSISGEKSLETLKLPEDLPALVSPANPLAECGPIYAQALQYYLDHRNELVIDPPDPKSVTALAELMIRAANAGKTGPCPFDSHIPFEPGARPDFSDAIERMGMALGAEYLQQEQRKKHEQANQALLAMFSYGHRLFTTSGRAYLRLQGLVLMRDAATLLSDNTVDKSLAEKASKWPDPCNTLQEAWSKKMNGVLSLTPNIADVVNVAKFDKDPTFRAEATLRLGIVKFNPRSRANLWKIKNAIAELKKSDDPQVAKAAATADAFTVEQLRRIN